MPRLRTARLLLRAFREEDTEEFERFATDGAYRRYLGDDHPGPRQLVENNLGVEGSWVIELDRRVVGSIFLGEELACLLDPAVHRQGIAIEAATAVISDGFARRGYDEIVARADPDNTGSLRAMSRLGFKLAPDGTHRLRRQDWPSRQHPQPS